MPKFIQPFLWRFILLFLCCQAGLLLYLIYGSIKPVIDWRWMDILGEGGSATLVLSWLLLMVRGRPDGRVTNFFFIGLSAVFFSLWMDALDEFIHMPSAIIWDSWIESAPMPIGLLLITTGIFFWHQEQLAISRQMIKRERLFRDHRLFDALTPLADANYFKTQLTHAIQEAQGNAQPLSVILLDMQDFEQINQQHGFEEGNHILQTVSQLLILNLRQHDLVCRLAADRFVIMLPFTGSQLAAQVALDLEKAIQAQAYYHSQHAEKIKLVARTTHTLVHAEQPQQVLARLHAQLDEQKQLHHSQRAYA